MPSNPACVHAKSLQSCPTLCDLMDCSPPGSSVRGDSPGKSTGVGCHALIQGVCLTQGLNQHLLHLLHWQAGSLAVVRRLSCPVASGIPVSRPGIEPVSPVLEDGFPTTGPSGKPHNLCFRSLGWKDPLEEGMATHSSILAWRIPTDRGVCWATLHAVLKSRTRPSD